VRRVKNPQGRVTVAIVGKYVELLESYKSLNEALAHGGIANDVRVDLTFVDAEDLEDKGVDQLNVADAVLVPGGFGQRGTEGKFAAVRFARENKVPFFGICLGLQSAVIEFARNVCGLENSNSTEFDKKSKHPVIDLMESQRDVTDMGATMRLGAYPCRLVKGSKAAEIYKTRDISERHRHRFEVNNEYRDQLSESGLLLSGLSPDGELVEMVELDPKVHEHPWFIGCQFHPEFKSRPTAPHPLFASFIAAAAEFKRTRK